MAGGGGCVQRTTHVEAPNGTQQRSGQKSNLVRGKKCEPGPGRMPPPKKDKAQRFAIFRLQEKFLVVVVVSPRVTHHSTKVGRVAFAKFQTSTSPYLRTMKWRRETLSARKTDMRHRRRDEEEGMNTWNGMLRVM